MTFDGFLFSSGQNPEKVGQFKTESGEKKYYTSNQLLFMNDLNISVCIENPNTLGFKNSVFIFIRSYVRVQI